MKTLILLACLIAPVALAQTRVGQDAWRAFRAKVDSIIVERRADVYRHFD